MKAPGSRRLQAHEGSRLMKTPGSRRFQAQENSRLKKVQELGFRCL
jgi:hypothetical protein